MSKGFQRVSPTQRVVNSGCLVLLARPQGRSLGPWLVSNQIGVKGTKAITEKAVAGGHGAQIDPGLKSRRP